ncbi:MAG: signal peptide peptidase SppA [Candidatus Micrarchaeota archaeon]
MNWKDIIITLVLIFGFSIIVNIIAVLWGALFPPPDCVGVIEINGELVAQGTSSFLGPGLAGSKDIAGLIKETADRREVKALLIEVNSPGGSIVASREIRDALQRAGKPKVAYLRETAASGGYYIIAGVDYIISDPATITGSIGARATVEDLSGLFEKLGINVTVVKSGEFKDIGDPTRPLTEEERKILQDIVDEIFEDFKSTVEQGRAGKLNEYEFSKILDARILTGKQAQRIGLVDELGGEQRAIDKAAELGKLKPSPPLCEVKKKASIFEEIFGMFARLFAEIVSNLFRIDVGGGWRLQYR